MANAQNLGFASPEPLSDLRHFLQRPNPPTHPQPTSPTHRQPWPDAESVPPTHPIYMYTLQGHVLQPAVRPQKPIGSSARHAHACADDPRESKLARPGSGACALLVGSLLSYAPAHVQPSLASLACGQQQGAELPLTLQGRRGCSLPPFVSSILSPSRMRMRHPARMAFPGPRSQRSSHSCGVGEVTPLPW